MKTAMKEFSQWLQAYEYELPLELQVKAKECLELEKEQIKRGYEQGYSDGYFSNGKSGNQYYNETYGGEK
jgi:flagellar biosynthesis/type III secretory pathway protein FliH